MYSMKADAERLSVTQREPHGVPTSARRRALGHMPYAEAIASLAPAGSLQLSPEAESTSPVVDAATQMANLLAYAEANHGGASTGQCFQYVWRYIHSSGYGKIKNYGDCPAMGSAEARMFAEFMNGGTNAAEWGIGKLSGSTPYDAPAGSIVVVGPGSPGTSHATAGDIAVARGDGTFINDGPQMNYGPPGRFLADGGSLLGIYAPAG